jgi:hypothetical protein
MDWKNPPDPKDGKPSFSSRKAYMRQDRQNPPDHEKSFDEAGESSENLSS